ncbi:MAG: site-specific integrase, partial [bacterium]|nr:site-specific integrase [bacterium]
MRDRRRSSGEGSIVKLKNGRWAAVIELLRHPNGKRNRKWRRARTEAEARRQLKAMREEHEELGGHALSGRTVDETVADYLQQVRAPKEPSKSDRARDHLFADTITAFFGPSRETADVALTDCDALLAAFASGEISASGQPDSRDYVKRLQAFLAAAIGNDVRQGYARQNPADLSLLPQIEVECRAKRALTIGQWQMLHTTARGSTRIGVDLGGRHGLRPQETRAVTWPEIDFDEGTISVVTQFDADDEFDDTKTDTSTRTLRIHPQTVDLLATWGEQQLRLAAPDHLLLIMTTRRGTPVGQESYRRDLKAACRRAEVPEITPYELRHTAITHQIEAGKDIVEVADWAGTSVQM